MPGEPNARGALGGGDVVRRHFARDLATPLDRLGAAVHSGDVEPLMRRDRKGAKSANDFATLTAA
jgi:hypothetical protein